MSTTNGYMPGKGRKVLNLVIEEAQHTDLKKLAVADRQSLAKVVRELLRQGLDTRHGLSTRKVAARVEGRVDALTPEITALQQAVQELKGIVANQKGQIEAMAREMTTTKSLVEHVAAMTKECLAEVKKGWFRRG